ncbi:MAG TPA: DUF1849 family protein, partial [Candidatus Nitrosotenuis sp.]|nr:DUF1849 family protein [Candidatus Nitrosotenuis sp.]
VKGLVNKYYSSDKKNNRFDHDNSPSKFDGLSESALVSPSQNHPEKEEQELKRQELPSDQEEKNSINNKNVVSAFDPSNILSHKATYSINLNKNYGQDDVADANGWMTIQVIDTGDGWWAFEQKSSLIIYNSEGEAQQINTSVNSWESYAGDRYRFTCSTLRNGVQEDNIKGEAIIQDNMCRVKYAEPTQTEIQLPGNTIFPLHYLIHSLNEAKSGKTVVSDIIFDGSSESQEPVAVDTIVGASRDPHLIISGTESLKIKKSWPMHIAVYPINSSNPDPDYEMEQTVLDVGIVKDMTLDYGTFSVKATIEKIELFTS